MLKMNHARVIIIFFIIIFLSRLLPTVEVFNHYPSLYFPKELVITSADNIGQFSATLLTSKVRRTMGTVWQSGRHSNIIIEILLMSFVLGLWHYFINRADYLDFRKIIMKLIRIYFNGSKYKKGVLLSV